MAGLLWWPIAWFLRKSGRGSADSAAYPSRALGSQTARLMRAIGCALTNSERDWIASLGESERDLATLRDSLTKVQLAGTAVDRDARAVTARIDAFLSEPGGLLARTLAPIRNQSPAESRRRIEKALTVASRLVTDARNVLDTAETLSVALARVKRITARHHGVVPGIVERSLDGAHVSDRLQAVGGPESARRMIAEIVEIERSIERQRTSYENLARELERVAPAAGIDPGEVRGKTTGIEEYTRELAVRVDAVCGDRLGAAFKGTLHTARQHNNYLAANEDFARSRSRVEGISTHAAMREWKGLHAMKPVRSKRGKRK